MGQEVTVVSLDDAHKLYWTVRLTAARSVSVSGQALGRAHCDSPNKWLERFYYPNPACSETRSEPPQEESLGMTPSPASPSPPPRPQQWRHTGRETDTGTDIYVTLTYKHHRELNQNSKSAAPSGNQKTVFVLVVYSWHIQLVSASFFCTSSCWLSL